MRVYTRSVGSGIEVGVTQIVLPGKRPRADELYDHLRAAIIQGDLQPNERLVEQAIAEQAQVSRTPVREALQRLEVDGLVRISSRGMVVVEFSDDELVELCVAREGMEGLAAGLAAIVRSDFTIATLERILEQTREATDAHDTYQLVSLNHAFHETIWQGARNRYLASELRLLRSLIERLQTTTLSSRPRQLESLREHTEIADALRRKDAADAEAVTRRHFRTAMSIRLSRRAMLANRSI
jgi:DNA-binding GntR family transcriptional regulator